jgi:hypothetical protein
LSKYRNISGGELDLRVPGFEQAVAAGEVVDIPDFQPDGESPIIVPPDKWQLVKEPKVAAEKKKTASSSEEDG